MRLSRALEALEDVDPVLAENPKHPLALHVKADALYHLGNFEHALVFYQRGYRYGYRSSSSIIFSFDLEYGMSILQKLNTKSRNISPWYQKSHQGHKECNWCPSAGLFQHNVRYCQHNSSICPCPATSSDQVLCYIFMIFYINDSVSVSLQKLRKKQCPKKQAVVDHF